MNRLTVRHMTVKSRCSASTAAQCQCDGTNDCVALLLSACITIFDGHCCARAHSVTRRVVLSDEGSRCSSHAHTGTEGNTTSAMVSSITIGRQLLNWQSVWPAKKSTLWPSMSTHRSSLSAAFVRPV